MTCIICHGEDVRTERVYEEIHHGDDIVRVPLEVPVCATCGERYYDRKTVQRLEQIRERLRGHQAVLREVGKVLICDG